MGTPLEPEQIAQRIRTILRRDLKLGASAELPASMPLMGGNMDLDSLDVLLLITNIEKEFGVKIASQEIGRQAFESVGGLIEFVTSKCQGAPAATSNVAKASAGDLLSKLPHQPPFRFITTVGKIVPCESGEGTWSVNGSEPFFAGHFPGNPLVPGVLIAEALAQLSGLVGAAASDSPQQGKLAQVDVRFVQSVAPPAEIVLQSKSLRTIGALQQFEVLALCKGAPVAQGTVAIAYAGSAEARK